MLKEVPGAPIIGEVKCSMTLFDDIQKHGGKPIMWKAGHSLIKAKMKEDHAALAGEMSGHIFFKDRCFGFDDGIYASFRLLEILTKRDVASARSWQTCRRVTSRRRFASIVPTIGKFEVVRKVAEFFGKHYEVIDIDGVRVISPTDGDSCARRIRNPRW